MIRLAKISHTLTRIYLDQWDLSGMLNAGGLTVKPETPVVTCLSDVGPRRVQGNYDHDANVGGFFDALDGTLGLTNIDAALNALKDDGSIAHYLTQVPALGAGLVAYDQLVVCAGEPRKWGTGQAIMLDASFVGSNGVARGNVLRTATITGTGDGAGVEQVATTAGQIYAVVFRVLSGTFDTFGLKIQDSDDDAATDAYADVTGLTATFADDDTPAVARVTTALATKLWKRVVVSAFTGTSAVILVTAGVIAGT